MEGPADLRMQPYAPARLFTAEEASAAIPRLTEIFRKMDPELARAREIQDLIEDAEAYWGSKGTTMPPDEKTAYDRLRVSLEETNASLHQNVEAIRAVGCELKDVNQGLIDFPALVEGRLAYLCWQRGEAALGYWHTLDTGFAARKPLPKAP